jgi:hypothetical protein
MFPKQPTLRTLLKRDWAIDPNGRLCPRTSTDGHEKRFSSGTNRGVLITTAVAKSAAFSSRSTSELIPGAGSFPDRYQRRKRDLLIDQRWLFGVAIAGALSGIGYWAVALVAH